MNRDPMDSFNMPFQSGDGLCYPIYAKNYYKTQTTPMFGGRKTSKKSQKGGNTIGNYSQPSSASDYPGNAYLSSSSERNALTGSGVSQQMNPLTEQFLNSNMGVTYATQAGGKRKYNKKNSLTLKSTEKQKQSGGKNMRSTDYISQEETQATQSVLSSSAPSQGVYSILSGGKYKKYNKKGGIGANAFDSNVGIMNQQNNNNSSTLKRAEKQQSGGKNMRYTNVVAEEEMQTKQMPSLDVYSILSGGKYKKYNKKGGNMPAGLIEGMQMGAQPGMQMAAQPGMQMGAQPGMQMAGQPGMQPGIQMGAQPGIQMGAQPGMQPGIQMGAQPGIQMGAQPGIQMGAQPGMQMGAQPGMQMDAQAIMSGGRYKKYSKKGGNYIFTPGANFSSQPAEIATQMDPLAQAQHTPRGGFAMKNLSGVDAQMAASRSFIKVMSGGRKKSSKKLKGGVSDFATTLSSRGPINYPDQPSADRFRYFNKTGTFIPNSQLQYAAAPISTGYEADPNPYPMAYNDYIGGAKKKKAPAKKKAAPPKKKAPAKKKAAPAKKKKSTSDKKKK
jgi:hypothetical protein